MTQPTKEKIAPEFYCIFHPEKELVDIKSHEYFQHHQNLKAKACPTCGWMPQFMAGPARAKFVRAGGRVVKETVHFV